MVALEGLYNEHQTAGNNWWSRWLGCGSPAGWDSAWAAIGVEHKGSRLNPGGGSGVTGRRGAAMSSPVVQFRADIKDELLGSIYHEHLMQWIQSINLFENEKTLTALINKSNEINYKYLCFECCTLL